jgi:uncharacterized ferritin-like protein (DUF455 family)
MDPSGRSQSSRSAPASLEDWAIHYVLSVSLADKRTPPPPGLDLGGLPYPVDIRPKRPPEFQITTDKPRSMKQGALENPKRRAEIVHKFWHHELQAAELMCWALLRFPDEPAELRRGLMRICRDEIRHMGLYEEHLGRLGYELGSFPVRDWFWERATTCPNIVSFLAFIGMGLEGANLEHTERFGGWFRAVSDERGAEIQDQVGREEVAHVRFATRWFRHFTGDVNFDEWLNALPPPISPLLLRGKKLRWDLREKAEMPRPFLERLESWEPEPIPQDPSGVTERLASHALASESRR